jgi:hypothetical protein
MKYMLIATGGYVVFRKLAKRSSIGDGYDALPIPATPVKSASVALTRGITRNVAKLSAQPSVLSQRHGSYTVKSVAPEAIAYTGPLTVISRPEVKKQNYKLFDISAQPVKQPSSAVVIPIPITPISPKGTTDAPPDVSEKEKELLEEVVQNKQSIKADMESVFRFMKEFFAGIKQEEIKLEGAKRRVARSAEGSLERWSSENDVLDAQITIAAMVRMVHEKTLEKYQDADRIIESTADMVKDSGLGDQRAREVGQELSLFRDACVKKYWLIPNPNPKPYAELGDRLWIQRDMRKPGGPI